MELLGDLGHMESRLCLFSGSANLDTRLVQGLCRTYHGLRKSFCMHPIELLGEVGHVEPRFGLFGDTVSVDAKIGSWFTLNVPQARKLF
jgi:hypothetical protein